MNTTSDIYFLSWNSSCSNIKANKVPNSFTRSAFILNRA
nr:MAG TPA: hypothetical protein [Caudoviricetes sp.]